MVDYLQKVEAWREGPKYISGIVFLMEKIFTIRVECRRACPEPLVSIFQGHPVKCLAHFKGFDYNQTKQYFWVTPFSKREKFYRVSHRSMSLDTAIAIVLAIINTPCECSRRRLKDETCIHLPFITCYSSDWLSKLGPLILFAIPEDVGCICWPSRR